MLLCGINITKRVFYYGLWRLLVYTPDMEIVITPELLGSVGWGMVGLGLLIAIVDMIIFRVRYYGREEESKEKGSEEDIHC